ncbi:MAG: trypsin-like peptidase domain-containing protein [Nanoarchaeota archaeon]
MEIEKNHHRKIVWSFSAVILVVLIANSIIFYVLFIKIDYTISNMNSKVNELETDTQTKINELTENILETRQSLGNTISSIDVKVNEIKASASSDFSGVISNSINSVVTVKTDIAQGTGFLISPDGYVVTNAHVLSGARKVVIVNSNQETLEAQFIGYDADLDIALLKTPETGSYLELANSDDVSVGEKVIAIGNPLGLQFSVSEGIVSAIDRPGPNDINAYIQTDAALNPGNSGGPLINKEGKVIGINNFKIGGGENLGFALESNYLKEAINNIAEQKLNGTLVN